MTQETSAIFDSSRQNWSHPDSPRRDASRLDPALSQASQASQLSQVSQYNGDDAIRSVVDDVMSGLVAARKDTSGAYGPTLIANRNGLTMHDEISEAIANSDSFDISVAFVTTGAIQSLLEDFRSHRANQANQANRANQARTIQPTDPNHPDHPRRPSRLITSTKSHFNDPQAFRELLHLRDIAAIDVRIWEGTESAAATSNGQPFHPKGYIFARHMRGGIPYYDLYVGSSNLTDAALNSQREWNLKISSLANGGIVRQFQEEIDSQIADSVPLTEEWIAQYEEDFKRYAPPRKDILKSLDNRDIQPNAMQKEALANLRRLREQGEHRAIIISATGTGKTFLSAFDVRDYQPKRMLYIAQQQMILDKAKESYRRILGCDESELGVYSGTSKQQDRRYVFATAQTMRQPEVLAQFASDEFDYILVDEVHHAGAEGYQRIIDHFKDADFMLGMTATPERTDGINIFELFGYNIAYEIRLQKALSENMLCPFHYYGVAEYLGTDRRLTINPANPANAANAANAAAANAANAANPTNAARGASAEDQRQLKYEISQLASEERVRYIIDKLQEYGQFGLPVTGLVFCSRQEEAHRLSQLFNRQWNQQAERPYRTAAVTSKDADGRPVSQKQRDDYAHKLECGELDYLFTVDMFNEGVDIPAVNQIVMLRSTESSIIFTQQLGRGLRKFPHKDSVVVIDFIGNYANNYLIPVALYGNTGDGDSARRNLQCKSIGLSSISFDPIAKQRILKSLDAADWSEMKKLAEQYRQVRYELGRIPMLMDIYRHDASLPVTLASKKQNYLNFVRSREKSLAVGRAQNRSAAASSKRSEPKPPSESQQPSRQPSENQQSSASQQTSASILQITSDTQDAILKMATALLLPGLRPHELVILDQLCRFAAERIEDDGGSPIAWRPASALGRESLWAAIRSRFPQADVSQADVSDAQFDSAIRVLDYSYFTEVNRKRFGGCPLIETQRLGDGNTPVYRLNADFANMLASNRTFRIFFADTLRTGLANCEDLFQEARNRRLTFDRAFLYERKYSMADVMRLCAWNKENTPQNVGGYLLDKPTGTMPIFVKYAASQYEDEFLSPQEMRYFSKNGRTPQSPEFQWLRSGASGVDEDWDRTHFVPLFVMRKAETDESRYYYVGHVSAVEHPRLTEKPNAQGDGTVKVTLSTLRLARPIDPELYRHLTS